MTLNEYKLLFPNSPLWSKDEKERQSKRYTGKNNPLYGIGHTTKSKKHLSKKQKEWCEKYGNQFEGKKHNKETIKYLKKVQTGKKASKETKRKMSESHKGLHYNIGENNPAYGIPVEKFAPKSNWAKVKMGIISPNNLNTVYGASSCEFIVYKYINNLYPGCIYHNIEGKISFVYYKNNRKHRKYPDLVFIDNNNKILFYIEVNGIFWHTRERTKTEENKRMKKIYEYSDSPLLVIWEDEINKDKYKQKINTFLSNFEKI